MKVTGILTLCCTVALALNTAYAVAYYKEKPSYVQTCKISEPGYSKCSTESMQKVIDQMIVGIPEMLAAIGPFDPMNVDPILVDDGDGSLGNLKFSLTNQIVEGLGKTVVRENRNSKRDFSGKTKFFVPRMHVTGDYALDGQILVLPLKGSGAADFVMEDLELTVFTKGHVYKRDDILFYNITDVNTKFTTSRFRTNLTNLFNGKSPEIEQSTNEFFNENWQDFLESMKPTLIKSFNHTFYKILNNLFSIMPIKFFVSDLPSFEESKMEEN